MFGPSGGGGGLDRPRPPKVQLGRLAIRKPDGNPSGLTYVGIAGLGRIARE